MMRIMMGVLYKPFLIALIALSLIFSSACSDSRIDSISNAPRIIHTPEDMNTNTGNKNTSKKEEEEGNQIKVLFLADDWLSYSLIEEHYIKDLKGSLNDLETEFIVKKQEDYASSLILMNSTGQLPDVFKITQDIAYLLMKSDRLQDLTHLVAEDGFAQNYTYPSAILSYVDGKVYAINCGVKFFHCPVILYWKDIFNACNIRSVPKNYDEFIACSREILNKGISPLTGDPYLLEAILFQQLIMAEDPEFAYRLATGKTGIYSEATLKAAQKLKELLCSGIVDYNIKSGNSGKFLFDQKKAAMYLTFTWNLSEYETKDDDFNKKYGLMQFPPISERALSLKSIQFWGDALDGYAISNKSKNTSLSFKVLKYLVEKDAFIYADLKKEILPLRSTLPRQISSQLAEYRLNAFKTSPLKIPTLVTIMKPEVYNRWKSELGSLWDPAASSEDFVEHIKLIWDKNFTD